jgi:hypothetical protein
LLKKCGWHVLGVWGEVVCKAYGSPLDEGASYINRVDGLEEKKYNHGETGKVV